MEVLFTRTPNALYDAMPEMGDAELRVSMAVVRATLGWQKESAAIRLSDFQSATGLSRQGAVNGIQAMLKRGLVSRDEDGQGFRYFLVNAVDQLSDSSSQRSRPVDTKSSQPSRPEVVNVVDQTDESGQRSRPEVVNVVDQFTPALKKSKENYIPPTPLTGDVAAVFRLWESNMPGTMTPIISDQIKDWIATFGANEVERAIEVAVKKNARHAAYVDAVLRRRAAGTDPLPSAFVGNSRASPAASSSWGALSQEPPEYMRQ